jgi:hypothetical protein
MSRFLHRYGPWLLALGLLLTPFFLPIPVGLRRHPAFGAMGDRVHIPLLFAITLLLHWRGPLAGRILGSATAAMVIGAAIEVSQVYVGRSALLADWLLDLFGIGMAVSWLLYRRHRDLRHLLPGLLLVVAAILQLRALPGVVAARRNAQRSFPMLADFESRWADRLWFETYDSHWSLMPSDVAHGTVLRLQGGPPSRWPGVNMRWFPPDWSSYRWLVFEARTVAPTAGEAEFAVRLDDWHARKDKDWFATSLVAEPDWRTFAIDLAAARTAHLERPLQLDDMDLLLFFFSRPTEPLALEIDNVRLVRD